MKCRSAVSSYSSLSSSVVSEKVAKYKIHSQIKSGLRRYNPAAIVLWAFHKIPCEQGVTSRRVINFLKKHFQTVDDPRKTGKSIGAMLRCAVDFGLLKKRGNKYFLVNRR